MEKLDLYRCNICGNIIQALVVGGGELVCCDEPMEKLVAKTSEDAMLEKHVPIFTKSEDGQNEIRIGEILHPMTNEHYIMFVEAISKDKNCLRLKFLHPGEEPRMILHNISDNLLAKEYCNIHGLWEGKND